MKTLSEWSASRLPFSLFASPGDQVDAGIFEYFRDSAPPAMMTARVLCVGDPFDHDDADNPRFTTFVQDGARIEYAGVYSIEDARLL
jgi:hypothetical protein